MIGVVVPSVFAETSAQEKYDPFSREQCHNETHVIPDKYVYESGETVTFTVEIFDPCYPARGNGYYDLELWVGHVSNELESDGEVGKVGVSIETILIKTGQQKTFQFTPEILTFTQEYLVLEKIGNGMNELIQYDQENNKMFDDNDGGMYLSFVVLPPQNTQEPTTSEGGGCLIATASYGSELSPQVQQLRELRDNQLLQTESGTQFMGTFNDVYYSFSPVIADYVRENPLFKEIVKITITPMILSLTIMENAESESEVLGLGLSVIALNLGLYLGVPAMVIAGIRKRI